MKKHSIPVVGLAAGLLVLACSDTTSPRVDFDLMDVQSVLFEPDDPSLITAQGNCTDLGDGTGASGASGKIEDGWEDGDPDLTITAPSGYLIYMYCVKAGSAQSGGGAMIIEVEPPAAQVTIDHPNVTSVSHYVAFYMEDPSEGGEWCSPGFWRNNPVAVAETGVDMTELYSAVFGAAPPRSPQGRRFGPADPTLQEVLDNPQWYGGDAFNNVGDLLSDAHPDVNFDMDTDARTEDSCPLSADRSRK